jgi:hypothetical protein
LKHQNGSSAKLRSIKPKSRWKFRWLKFLGLTIAVFMVLFVLEAGWLLITNLFKKVVVANWGSIEKGCWLEALYLREEKVVTAPVAGRLTAKVKTGDRIPRDEIIVWIDSGNAFFDKKIEASDDQIATFKKLQHYLREESALHMDLRRINRDLEQSEPQEKINSNPDLILLKQEKERVLRTIQSVHSIGERYRREFEPLFTNLTFVAVEEPGYFTYEYDGYETSLSPKAFPSLKAEDFGRKYLSKKPGGHVKNGEVLGKLINPFQQMIALKVDTRNIAIPKKGDIWRIKTKSGWKNGPVSDFKPLGENQAIVGVEIQAVENEQLTSRTAKMFVIYQKVSGVIVPVQSLFHHDGIAYVRVVKGESYQEKAVDTVATDGGRAIITGIDAGAIIISR